MPGQVIGLAEFKTHCLRIVAEAERTGESVTITRRGKPVVELKPIKPEGKRLTFGCLARPGTWVGDATSPAVDESEVMAANPDRWDEWL
jgi:prevent-host-death family protein